MALHETNRLQARKSTATQCKEVNVSQPFNMIMKSCVSVTPAACEASEGEKKSERRRQGERQHRV